MVKKNGLPVNLEEMVKKVASGELLPSEGKIEGVKVKIQNNLFSLDVRVLVLVGCDMVMRIQWLKELGSVL